MTKGYGFTVDDIDWSCPADLEPYEKAYRLQLQQQDSQLYAMGMYALSAVSVAIEHNFAANKTKSKYIEKPFLQEIEKKKKENKELTDEEKKQQTEQLFMQLRIMGANFNLKK